MILLIKHKCRFYRRFELDIWGLSYIDIKATNKNFMKSWYLRFFFKIYLEKIERRWKKRRRYIYRIDIIDIIKRKKKFNKRWVSIRLTRLYFLTLQNYQFRILFNKAKKLNGDLETNYCFLLECRLLPLFYRTNFIIDLFKIIKFIKENKVLINFKCQNYLNSIVNLGSIITFKKSQKKFIKYLLLKRLKLKAILFNTPQYLFVSFRFFFGFLLKKPKRNNFVYPINIDIQRISGYY
jgi:ribosomal protein S4